MIGLQPSRLQAELVAELERCRDEGLWQHGFQRGLQPWRGAGLHVGHYRNPPDFLLQHGRQFPSPDRTAWSPIAERGRCFANSVLAMQHAQPKLRYAEGVVWSAPATNRFTGQPVGDYRLVHHAWNVDRMERVVDFTYQHSPIAAQSIAYFGVVFPDDELVGRVAWDEDGTLLDHAVDQWALLREPWIPVRRTA